MSVDRGLPKLNAKCMLFVFHCGPPDFVSIQNAVGCWATGTIKQWTLYYISHAQENERDGYQAWTEWGSTNTGQPVRCCCFLFLAIVIISCNTIFCIIRIWTTLWLSLLTIYKVFFYTLARLENTQLDKKLFINMFPSVSSNKRMHMVNKQCCVLVSRCC